MLVIISKVPRLEKGWKPLPYWDETHSDCDEKFVDVDSATSVDVEFVEKHFLLNIISPIY